MHAPKFCLILFALLSLTLLLATPAPAQAYVGPGPGREMVPYFFSLLAWAGMALGATLLWPISSLVRRLWSGSVEPTGAAEQ